MSAYVDTVESPAKYNVTGSVGVPPVPLAPVDVVPPSPVVDVVVVAPPAPSVPAVVAVLETLVCVDAVPLVDVTSPAPPAPELLTPLVVALLVEADDTAVELATEVPLVPIAVGLDPAPVTAPLVVEVVPSPVLVTADPMGSALGGASGSPQPRTRKALAATPQKAWLRGKRGWEGDMMLLTKVARIR